MFVCQKVEIYLSIRNQFKKNFHSLPLKTIAKRVELSFESFSNRRLENKYRTELIFQELLYYNPQEISSLFLKISKEGS